MYLTIILLPLTAAIIAGAFGRKLGSTGAQIITISSLSITSILVVIAFIEVGFTGVPVNLQFTSNPWWIESGAWTVSWGFTYDSLTVVMLIPILFVSTLVQIYTVDYMSHDPHNQRFFSYLTLFSFFMILLVTADNYLFMFVAWEGVGIVSFLLINFWFTRTMASKAAMQALTQNRVGDMLLTLGIFTSLFLMNSLDFTVIASTSPYLNSDILSIIALFFVGGAIAKSAQLILNSWLPWSMEGPTPVSSLLHAATLVVCGVYLLIRSSPILEFTPEILNLIMWIGAITSIYAALSGLLQNDMKRIIAFSTISQMGYLFVAIGMSQYSVALLHMSSHAFFKALLFLCAGAIIHSLADVQDIRKLGGLQKFLPFVYSSMIIGSLSLMALPWTSGFYSKDLIIELAYANYTVSGYTVYLLGSITAGLTAFYSFRLLALVFWTYPNANKNMYNNIHQPNLFVIIPLLTLSLFSIFYGYIASDLFIGMGSDFLSRAGGVFVHPNNVTLIEAEFSLPLGMKLLPTILTFLGASSAYYLYNYKPLFLIDLTNSSLGRSIYGLLNGKFYMDVLISQFIIGPSLLLGNFIMKSLDKGIIEAVGPTGLWSRLSQTSSNIVSLDHKSITDYASYFVIGILTLSSIIVVKQYVSDYNNILELFNISLNELWMIFILLAISVYSLPSFIFSNYTK